MIHIDPYLSAGERAMIEYIKDIPPAPKSALPPMYIDRLGRAWFILERKEGSVSIYYTLENDPAQYVIWDSLDK